MPADARRGTEQRGRSRHDAGTCGALRASIRDLSVYSATERREKSAKVQSGPLVVGHSQRSARSAHAKNATANRMAATSFATLGSLRAVPRASQSSAVLRAAPAASSHVARGTFSSARALLGTTSARPLAASKRTRRASGTCRCGTAFLFSRVNNQRLMCNGRTPPQLLHSSLDINDVFHAFSWPIVSLPPSAASPRWRALRRECLYRSRTGPRRVLPHLSSQAPADAD